MSHQDILELRFLGEMQVLRGGVQLELPPSKKTRGLLAYLVLSGRAHRRERLCNLLWDVADDPRGALRWSLSRLRALVDEPGRPRIHAPREQVAFEQRDAHIDILSLRQRAADGLDAVPLADLRALAGEFRGELLEGLDFDDFMDFQAWCIAEREEARKLHAHVLWVLIGRLVADPEAALPYARTLVDVDPHDEAARAGLVRVLAATGRHREAEQQYQVGRRLLDEFGRPPSGALEKEWRAARAATGTSVAATRDVSSRPPPVLRPAVSLVGRDAERRKLELLLEDTVRERREHVLLLGGDPGLGKSCLLEVLCAQARERGGIILEGRAFEVEGRRPFGPWIDALRQLPEGTVTPAVGADLGTLLPELARDDGIPQSRDRLFNAVLELVAAWAASAPPVVLAFDDAHWLDAASAELVHYIARMSRHRPLLVALTARAGELSDNEVVQRTLHGLRAMGLLEEIGLAPLDRETTRELVSMLGPDVDAERIFAESRGNPLFALEIARSLPEHDDSLPGSLTDLIRHRVERLPADVGEVLRWAAVLGTSFNIDRLGALLPIDIYRLLNALELLERHALLRGHTGSASAANQYSFAHELVRRAVYSDLSPPRRRLMHLRVAEQLGQAASTEDVAADLAHHAAQAGDNALAARACAAAGQRFLRQFANQEAWVMARRGRRHAAEVAETDRIPLLLKLLHVEHQARRPDDIDAAARELEALAERALEQGSTEDARLGFQMLSYLRWEEGEFSDAHRHMMRAEMVSRAGGETEQIVAMAEAARCLVLLERDLPRAEALALEASARSTRAGQRPSAVADAQGMLRQHQGQLDEAVELYERARLEARQAGNANGEFQALEHLVVLRQQTKAWSEALPLAIDLVVLGEKLRGGSEAPFARALLALSRYALGDAQADDALEAAVEELRVADAKLRLAYTLTRAARIDLERGDPQRACRRAEESRRMAAALGRPTESLLAAITLAHVCRALGRNAECERLLEELRRTPLTGVAHAARTELEELLGEATGHEHAASEGRKRKSRPSTEESPP